MEYHSKSDDGTTTFGEIREDSGLAPAPIKLSRGYQDENGKGYGLAHIEANHGEQIRNAGFNSIEEFVRFVAQNYDKDNIRVGKRRESGSTTYLIQVTDEYDNTLFIEMSRDGNYWNVNSAGVFRKGYSNKKETVAKTEPQQPNNAVSTGSSLSANVEDGITSAEPNGKPTVSAGKDNASSANEQGKGGKNADGYDVTSQQINDYINDVTPNNPYGRRLSQRLPQRVGRAVERKQGIAAVDALFSRASESAVRPHERTRAEGRRAIEEGKKKGLEQWHIVQPLRNAQEGGYKPIRLKVYSANHSHYFEGEQYVGAIWIDGNY